MTGAGHALTTAALLSLPSKHLSADIILPPTGAFPSLFVVVCYLHLVPRCGLAFVVTSC